MQRRELLPSDFHDGEEWIDMKVVLENLTKKLLILRFKALKVLKMR